MRYLRIALVSSALLATMLLVGCAKDAAKEVVGTWNMSGKVGAMQSAGGTTPTQTLVIKSDKTFTMGEDAKKGGNGTWSVSGKKLSLQFENIGGMSIAEYKDMMKKLMSGFADLAKSMAKSVAGAKGAPSDMDAKMAEGMKVLDNIEKPIVMDLSDDFKSAKPDTTTGMLEGITDTNNGSMTKVSS